MIETGKTTLMFSYGSNMNLSQMAKRCPAAEPLGGLRMPNRRLVFRAVADCIAEPGAVCYGGVWRITEACERTLDIYEGVRTELYRKEYIPVNTPEGDTHLLIYVMNSTGIFPPSAAYLASIRQGYRDFQLPKRAVTLLNKAVHHAWDDKAPTYIERQRHRRKGRPLLAQRPKQPATAATGKEITLPAQETKE